MCLKTLHDKVRSLGLGALYERHWGRGEFRGLFDDQSPDWADTAVGEKVVALRAFETAGVPTAELIEHYCETLAGRADHQQALERLPAVMRTYRDAGYAPPLPEHLAAVVDAPAAADGPT